MKYRAFISYSHKDSKWGDWLHAALERFRVPRGMGPYGGKRIYPVFRDREELPTATDLSRTITGALRESACLIVICSPSAARSRWVNEEILEFRRLGRSGRILAIIVDGEPNADVSREGGLECFPEALRHPLGSDGELDRTRRIEPVAADCRPSGDGRRAALVKLAAGVLGVSYDSLRRREEIRRRRRLRITLAMSFVLMGLFASLAGFATVQWRAAERERGQRSVELAVALHGQGMGHWEAGRREDAVPFFTAAHRLQPQSPYYRAALASLPVAARPLLSPERPVSIGGVPSGGFRRRGTDRIVAGVFNGPAVEVDIAEGRVVASREGGISGVQMLVSSRGGEMFALNDMGHVAIWGEDGSLADDPVAEGFLSGLFAEYAIAPAVGAIFGRSQLIGGFVPVAEVPFVVWDSSSGRVSSSPSPSPAAVGRIEAGGCGEAIYVLFDDGSLYRWRTVDGFDKLDFSSAGVRTFFTGPGQWLGVVGNDGKFTVADGVVGVAAAEFPAASGGVSGRVVGGAFSHCGESVAIVIERSQGGYAIDVRERQSGKLSGRIAPLASAADFLEFAADGELIYLSFDDGRFSVWDYRQRQHLLSGHHGNDRIFGGFLQCGLRVWTVGNDGYLRVWHIGQRISGAHVLAASGRVVDLAFDSDSGLLGVLSGNPRYHQVWRLGPVNADSDGRVEVGVLHSPIAHDGRYPVSIKPSGGNSAFIIVDQDSGIEVWDEEGRVVARSPAVNVMEAYDSGGYFRMRLPEQTIIQAHSGDLLISDVRIDFSALSSRMELLATEGEPLAVADQIALARQYTSGRIQVLDPLTLAVRTEVETDVVPIAMAATDAGNCVMYVDGSASGRVGLLNFDRLNGSGEVERRSFGLSDGTDPASGQQAIIVSRGMSADGEVIFLQSPGTGVTLYRRGMDGAYTGTRLETESPVRSAVLSRDGRRLALTLADTGDKDRVRIIDTASATATGTDIRHGGRVRVLVFSDDGRWLFTGASDGKARVLWSESGAVATVPFDHPDEVLSLIWDAPRQLMITGCADGRVRLWPIALDREIPLWLPDALEEVWERTFAGVGNVRPVPPGMKYNRLELLRQKPAQMDDGDDPAATAGSAGTNLYWLRLLSNLYESSAATDIDGLPADRNMQLHQRVSGYREFTQWRNDGSVWAVGVSASGTLSRRGGALEIELNDLKIERQSAGTFDVKSVSVGLVERGNDGRWGIVAEAEPIDIDQQLAQGEHLRWHNLRFSIVPPEDPGPSPATVLIVMDSDGFIYAHQR